MQDGEIIVFDQDFSRLNSDSDYERRRIKSTYSDAMIKANEKANNLESWINSPSIYLIDQFISKAGFGKDTRKVVLNFKVQQKSYNCFNLVSSVGILDVVLNKYTREKNKKNAYKFSGSKDNGALSKELFSIIIDYIEHILESEKNNIEQEPIIKIKTLESTKDLDEKDSSFNLWKEIPSSFTTRFKNFERDILITEYASKKDDIDNKGMRTLVYGSSQVFFVSSGEHFFIMTYSPSNDQYYNQKLKEVDKAPNFSFFIYSKEVEDFFTKYFHNLDSFHRNFMQFTYLADTNQNIVNAMGESSLIAQYWYTESVNRILNDHNKELKKSKDSQLLAEYIVRYILGAEIDGVESIEVYPFDRVFLFNNSIFEPNKNDEEITVFEGLLESKVPHEMIRDKKFLGGKTQYCYEWEREKTGFGLDRFNPSKKKIKKVVSHFKDFSVDPNSWDSDYIKNSETVINNLLFSLLNGDSEEKKTQMLEYKSKFTRDGITYLYSSGTSLNSQVKTLFNLQKFYLENLPEEPESGIQPGIADNLTSDIDYFENVKIVLFSYTPEDVKSEKGFTLVILANDDVPKSLMEQKSEKDDLHTALKLLINQHFTIDSKYKEQSIREQNELVDILTQTLHTVKNSFENYKSGDIDILKEKVLSIIDQDRIQMIEQGRDAVEKKFDFSTDSTQSNSLAFYKSIFSTFDDKKQQLTLNKKFSFDGNEPWDYFAREIYNFDFDLLQKDRCYIFSWKSPDKVKKQLDLVIHFGEIENFQMEWKESLFNDAIYVMLKNACEHSIETINEKEKKRTIFIDVYLTKNLEYEFLNLEFMNHTGKICEDMFEHINTATTIRNNSNKAKSTGIGVVTIRKRLEVTYGKNVANISFSLLNANHIKSLLYFPVKTLPIKKSVFLDSSECNKKAEILYLEDSEEYYEKNNFLLKQSGLTINHYLCVNKSYAYEDYDILITDINIFGENDNKALSSNGEDAIKYYIAKNKNGVIIVLSSDIDSIDEFDGYKNIKNIESIVALMPGHIYFCKIKILDKKLLSLVKDYIVARDNGEKDSNAKALISSKEPNIKNSTCLPSDKQFIRCIDFSSIRETKEPLGIDLVNQTLFLSDDLFSDAPNWLQKKVQKNLDLTDDISNCEIPHVYLTKLIIYSNFTNFILKHELLIRNIVVVPEMHKGEEEETIAYVLEMNKYNLTKKGLFGKISHDILNKMPEFSVYNKEKIEEIKKINTMVRNDFRKYFDIYLTSRGDSKELGKLLSKAEKNFTLLTNELHTLKNRAITEKNDLGTDIENIVLILEKLDFVRN